MRTLRTLRTLRVGCSDGIGARSHEPGRASGPGTGVSRPALRSSAALLTLGLAMLCPHASAQVINGGLVDDFVTGQAAGTGTTADDPEILGGEREVVLPIFFSEPLASSSVASGVFRFGFDGFNDAIGLIYDGDDDNPFLTDADGLTLLNPSIFGGFDLTAGGTVTAFELEFRSNDIRGLRFQITAQTFGGIFAISPLVNVPELDDPDIFTAPLVTFSNAGALDNVGNIQIVFSANPDLFENTTSFADLEEIRLVPEPSAGAAAAFALLALSGARAAADVGGRRQAASATRRRGARARRRSQACRDLR